MQSVRLQPQASEKGFWAWGRVTINLVKSADESLSHSYNQRHFRPLLPLRNSCFLWHVLKFYFKNSLHLKAECCPLPRPPLTMCFQFSQSYHQGSGCELLPSADPLEKDLAWLSCAQDLIPTFPSYFLLRGKSGVRIVTLERIVLFGPLILVKETEAWPRDGNPFYPVLLPIPSAQQFLKPISCPHLGLECFLIVSSVPVHTWVCLSLCVCWNLNITYLFLRHGNWD